MISAAAIAVISGLDRLADAHEHLPRQRPLVRTREHDATTTSSKDVAKASTIPDTMPGRIAEE